MVKKQYTNTWFAERGGKTWDKILEGNAIMEALEIGCYEGQASVYLLEKFPDMYLHVVDLFDASAAEDWNGYVDDYEKRFDNNIKPYENRVHKYKGKSFKYLNYLYSEGFTFDFIYVDGDHRALPAMQDMCMAVELLDDCGVMIIDDYVDIPWLTDSIDKFVSLLPEDEYKYELTPDKEQMVIYRIA